ncbi:PKD domain-containing protein [Halostella sp. JP-L12]|uniref:PKD domain-containing protein n=1 Tax=Halostella TaxID=1843185 RepID=UPI0013CE9998|nr:MULTISPECIES: PKD domain-containing protein [Halostella]NHN49470.1 PKD domain-containing protein [Halostella sp. JP-L12]
MTSRRDKLRSAALALLMVTSVFATVNVAALGFVGTAEAAPGDPATFAVTQNGQCFEVSSFGDGTQSVENFYDYRPTSSGAYSSHGTTEFQENDTTQMFLYNGSEGVSLVVVHDKLNGDDSGGNVTFNVSGVPSGSEWAVRDDYYENNDGEQADTNYDNFSIDGDTAHADWFWVDDRTDGGALRAPQGAEFSMTVTPAFNEDAHHDHPDGRYNGGQITTWNVRSPDGTAGGGATELDMSQPVSIETGGCGSAPDASLDATPANASIGENVTFDASGSVDEDGDIAEYRWDFDGDGQVDRTTQGATTQAAYDAAGEYEASVTVVDEEDRSDTATANVSVSESLTAHADVPSGVEVNETFTADGSNSTGDVRTYEWDFGDGTTRSGETVDHAYDQTGTYTVTLTVSDGSGDEDTTTAEVTVTEPDETPPNASLTATPENASLGENVTFDAGDSSDDGTIAEYRWDFDGDGQVDRTTQGATTQTAYDAAGEYEASVTVVDTGDNEDTATATVTVSDETPPNASANVPSRVAVGDTFTADGSDSTDNGEIVSYEWDFGDGANATGQSVTHAYDENGTYEVTLTVTDAAGNADSDTVTVEAVDADEDAAPNASLDATPSTANTGETVTFDASGSSDDDGIIEYRWDFDGDGKVDRTTESATAEKTYEHAGEYGATVTVVDTAGQTDTASATVTVEDSDDGGDGGDAPPTAAVTAPETVVVNETFEIDASGSTDDDGIVEYRWDFNDDGKIDRTTTEAKTIKVYNRPKTFTTEVTVVDASGQTDSATVTIEATEPDDEAPTGDVHAPETVNVGEEFAVNVTNVHDESGIAHVCWYFDGEKGPDGRSATVAFDSAGTHTVSVLLRDEEGNERTISTQVEVVAEDDGGDSGGDGGNSGGNTGGNTGGSAGGNTGGHTGGSAGSADDGDESDGSSMETEVDTSAANVVALSVTGADAGDHATVAIPADNWTEALTFDGMTTTFDAAGDYDLTVESSADAPENVTAPTVEGDGFAPQAYLTVDHPNVNDEDVRNASITFTVQKDLLDRTDAEPDAVGLYRATNGSWERVEVEHLGENGSVHEFRANLTELSTFAAGVDRPSTAVTEVAIDDTDVKAGDVIEVTATVANDGRADGTVAAELTVDGTVVASENVSVAAGETATVAFEHELASAGTLTVGVNGETTDLSVASVETDDSDDATESTTEAGDGSSDDSDDPDESNSLGQPGMGVGAALVALLCASLVALRRRD